MLKKIVKNILNGQETKNLDIVYLNNQEQRKKKIWHNFKFLKVI